MKTKLTNCLNSLLLLLYKVMGQALPELVDQVVEVVQRHAPGDYTPTVKPSSKGNYHSVSITINATHIEQVETLYETGRGIDIVASLSASLYHFYRLVVLLHNASTLRSGGGLSDKPLSRLDDRSAVVRALSPGKVLAIVLMKSGWSALSGIHPRSGGKSETHLIPGDIPVIQSDRGGQVTYHGLGTG